MRDNRYDEWDVEGWGRASRWTVQAGPWIAVLASVAVVLVVLLLAAGAG